jgi:hypothetical protein
MALNPGVSFSPPDRLPAKEHHRCVRTIRSKATLVSVAEHGQPLKGVANVVVRHDHQELLELTVHAALLIRAREPPEPEGRQGEVPEVERNAGL